MERRLTKWILEQKEKGVVLRKEDVRGKALSMQPHPYFKGSRAWMRRFIFRNPSVKEAIQDLQSDNMPTLPMNKSVMIP